MGTHEHPLIVARRAQMFPTLEAFEIDRLRRFGTPHAYPAGACLAKTGEVGPGIFVILSGTVEIAQQGEWGGRQIITTHGPGSFMGELAQLSGRPALVDACATSAVEALVIPSQRVPSMMMEEEELGERFMRALILRRVGLLETGAGGPVILGRAGNGDVLRLQGFLARNGHPVQRLDPDEDAGARLLLERFHVAPDQLPIVLCPNGQMLRNPSEEELARCIGLLEPIDATKLYDVAIVGAGPAGLAAAVYAGSEGLSAMVCDTHAFGGQAGASARIENYLGFPTGISGMALMARAFNQAQKFGVEMSIPDHVTDVESSLEDGKPHFVLSLGTETLRARAVVIASGARYRRLDVADLAAYEGISVHYWASPLEGRLCAGQEIVLVGGGNSAGQAAVYLSGLTAKVWLLIRRSSLDETMSHYLVERIAARPNIEVVTETEITALEGENGALEAVRWRHRSGKETRQPVRHVFLFIGADPNTAWLSKCDLALDGKGFVRTGGDAGAGRHALETSRAGIFAIGDVRAGSVKRVAAAVGEGAQVVAALHAYLAAPAVSAISPQAATK